MEAKGKLIQVQTTTDSREVAEKLAKGLVSSKHCACVKIIPNVSSTYMWKDKPRETEEFLVIATTLSSEFVAVERYIQAHHNYELPEVVAVGATHASSEYFAWVKDIVW